MSSTTQPFRQSTTPPTRPRRRTARTGLVAAAALTVAGLALTGCGTPVGASDRDDVAASSATFTYSGTVEQYSVPDGVYSLDITATGGGGGTVRAQSNSGSYGAQVTGTLTVQPRQLLLISVGQQGASTDGHDTDPKGGWGGLGANGGNGNAAKDTSRSGAAGGGASTVQLANADGSDPQTVLVAGGGGGAGGGSGDPSNIGYGGSAGCNGAPWWPGSNGSHGSSILGGKGGNAAGEAGMAGGRGDGGSATRLMTGTGVNCSTTTGNGQVVITPASS